MSTNYYWKTLHVDHVLPTQEKVDLEVDRMDPRVHIGKTYSAGPRGLAFIWAQEPEVVRRACANAPTDYIVVDGYGREYTGAEFLGVLDRVRVEEREIGEWFS